VEELTSECEKRALAATGVLRAAPTRTPMPSIKTLAALLQPFANPGSFIDVAGIAVKKSCDWCEVGGIEAGPVRLLVRIFRKVSRSAEAI